jgi:tRNA(fMet)-specific endonuclease VapC
MPQTYLLDTNIVSYFVRGNYPEVRRRIVRTPPGQMAVSAVTEAELLFWVANNPASARTRVGVADFLLRVPSLPWDSGAAQAYATTRELLRRQGRVLSAEDLMIAAHALSLGLILVTHDIAFSLPHCLKTEDWTVV